jgi:hypothetical protein
MDAGTNRRGRQPMPSPRVFLLVYHCLVSAPSICIGEMGELELLGAGDRGRGFDVISVLLRVFFVRSRCTVLVVLF